MAAGRSSWSATTLIMPQPGQPRRVGSGVLMVAGWTNGIMARRGGWCWSNLISAAPSCRSMLSFNAAMYSAKHGGKNRCVVFDPSMHATALARRELQVDLALAVEQHDADPAAVLQIVGH